DTRLALVELLAYFLQLLTMGGVVIIQPDQSLQQRRFNMQQQRFELRGDELAWYLCGVRCAVLPACLQLGLLAGALQASSFHRLIDEADTDKYRQAANDEGSDEHRGQGKALHGHELSLCHIHHFNTISWSDRWACAG